MIDYIQMARDTRKSYASAADSRQRYELLLLRRYYVERRV